MVEKNKFEQQIDGIETLEIITENKDEQGKLKDKIIHKMSLEHKTAIVVK